MNSQARVVRAPKGNKLTCKGWVQEAAYRMIQNNLDPEVAESFRKSLLFMVGEVKPHVIGNPLKKYYLALRN